MERGGRKGGKEGGREEKRKGGREKIHAVFQNTKGILKSFQYVSKNMKETKVYYTFWNREDSVVSVIFTILIAKFLYDRRDPTKGWTLLQLQ